MQPLFDKIMNGLLYEVTLSSQEEMHSVKLVSGDEAGINRNFGLSGFYCTTKCILIENNSHDFNFRITQFRLESIFFYYMFRLGYSENPAKSKHETVTKLILELLTGVRDCFYGDPKTIL